MKFIFIISLSISAIVGSNLNAKEACFLFISGEEKGQEYIIYQFIKPLLNSYFYPIKSVPPRGLKQSDLKTECFFEVSITRTGLETNLSISSLRSPYDLTGFQNQREISQKTFTSLF